MWLVIVTVSGDDKSLRSSKLVMKLADKVMGRPDKTPGNF